MVGRDTVLAGIGTRELRWDSERCERVLYVIWSFRKYDGRGIRLQRQLYYLLGVYNYCV
jgi:hypothetical protein